MTANEVRTAFEDAKDELIDDSKFYRWINYIESILYEKLVNIDSERFIAEEEYTITSDINEYSLPVDFSHINAKSCGIFSLTSSGKLSTKISGYSLKKDKIYLKNPINTTVLLRYIPCRTEIVSGDDIVLGSKDFLSFYEHALSEYLAILDEEIEDENISIHRAEKILEQILNNYNRNNSTLDISVGDFY